MLLSMDFHILTRITYTVQTDTLYGSQNILNFFMFSSHKKCSEICQYSWGDKIHVIRPYSTTTLVGIF